MLGIYPYAPIHALFLDPHLPEWLPEITIENIRIGLGVVTIRFFRNDDGAVITKYWKKRDRCTS